MQLSARRDLRQWSIIGLLGVLSSAPAMVATPVAQAKTAATIIVGQGIGGINIGMTMAQVRKTHGAPVGTRTESPGDAQWQYGNEPIGILVNFLHGRVAGMWTPREEYKTSKGIDVNSSPAQVRKAYPKAKCTLGASDPQLGLAYNGG